MGCFKRAGNGRYRHEYKYLTDSAREAILLTRAAGLMERDLHVGDGGSYLVRSLYFDDLEDSCLWENESGTDLRTKFRLRYYGADSTGVHLEKKSKVHGMTLKESCPVSEAECRLLTEGEMPEADSGMPKEKQRLFLEMRLRRLVPKVIVTYERIPFVYPGGNVRVTFDRNISSSGDISHFLRGDYGTRPVLAPGSNVLEVKWDEVLPLHIKEAMGLDTLVWTAFSKYYMCRMFHL